MIYFGRSTGTGVCTARTLGSRGAQVKTDADEARNAVEDIRVRVAALSKQRERGRKGFACEVPPWERDPWDPLEIPLSPHSPLQIRLCPLRPWAQALGDMT